jgi:hypothetical protein
MGHIRYPGRTISASLLGLILSGGCSSALETGYAYRPLGASSTERRGYYASPFTPEAQAAEQTKPDASIDARHPGGGMRGP